MNELIIMQYIQHPNVIEAQKIYQNKEQYFIVMELFDKGTLMEHIIEQRKNKK